MAILEAEVASLKEEVEEVKEEAATAVAERVSAGEKAGEQVAVCERDKTSLKVSDHSPNKTVVSLSSCHYQMSLSQNNILDK